MALMDNVISSRFQLAVLGVAEMGRPPENPRLADLHMPADHVGHRRSAGIPVEGNARPDSPSFLA
jgi:hypothetical protein